MKKWQGLSLCLAAFSMLLLAACNRGTDKQNSTQPTPSAQPTATPTPTPTPTPPIPFADVAENAYYYDAVVWAYKNGIASDEETFGPADPCTRGQVMTFLWRAKGSPEPQTAESPFSDVSSTDWFYKPALWAYENGIATGTAFNPGNSCTNAEALTFLWRAEGKPAASVYNSTVALAAFGQYYARPAAWAEINGLFARMNFDPAAPCSRAGLMAYLYYATEQWTFDKEDEAVQAEYEQIINDAQLYEVHSSGLIYADYVDVEGDGKVELLTLAVDRDAKSAYHNAIATVYANIGGHVEKCCETTLPFYPGESISTYRADNRLYLCYSDFSGNAILGHQFYRLENGDFVLENDLMEEYGPMEDDEFGYSYSNLGHRITATEYNAILQKYTDKRELFSTSNGYTGTDVSIRERGLLPSLDEYWTANRNRIYADVKNGDFSFFAGTYVGQIMDYDRTYTLNKNGGLDGGGAPVSITVADSGVITCMLWEHKATGLSEVNDYSAEFYEIYPYGTDDGYKQIRMYYVCVQGGVEDGWLTKVS